MNNKTSTKSGIDRSMTRIFTVGQVRIDGKCREYRTAGVLTWNCPYWRTGKEPRPGCMPHPAWRSVKIPNFRDLTLEQLKARAVIEVERHNPYSPDDVQLGSVLPGAPASLLRQPLFTGRWTEDLQDAGDGTRV